MYNALAEVAKHQKDKDTFRQLAKEEGHHASVFHKLTQTELTPKHTKEILLPLLYRIFPRWILYPAIAQGEYAAVKTYAPVAEKFPEVEMVELKPLEASDKKQFIKDNQKAFNYGALDPVSAAGG